MKEDGAAPTADARSEAAQPHAMEKQSQASARHQDRAGDREALLLAALLSEIAERGGEASEWELVSQGMRWQLIGEVGTVTLNRSGALFELREPKLERWIEPEQEAEPPTIWDFRRPPRALHAEVLIGRLVMVMEARIAREIRDGNHHLAFELRSCELRTPNFVPVGEIEVL